jgi:hypothetical protein
VTRQRLELADIVRAHRDDFVAFREGRVSRAERRVLDDIAACRTAARGGHIERCDRCGHQRIAYNSCRNRHCPKCQESARTEWSAEREREVLPVEYFHVVFTIPHEIAEIALQNKKLLYDLLFHTSAEALSTIAEDPAHLGAKIGFLSVLHTWGQNLDHHPHIHCLVPGGGLSEDGSQWTPCRPGFFLPVRVLGRLFRGKLLHHLRDAFERGKLDFHGRLARLKDPSRFRLFLAPLYEKKWRVYSTPPVGEAASVVRYLARYTHRVAISNNRLIAFQDDRVTFAWKDYRHHGRKRRMALGAVQFLRRFLLHILPKGFMRVRYYGFLANRCRRAKLAVCRRLLAEADASDVADSGTDATRDPPMRCPACRRGRMACILVLRPGAGFALVAPPPAWDTS